MDRGIGILRNIRVLDMSRVIAGPHCTRMLADLGADVIKLEPPDGDQTRRREPTATAGSSGFTQLNVGKRNISLDLDLSEARDVVRALASKCDVLVENFRPGVMAAWGLDFAALSLLNPGLIYVSISGYGQHGTWRHRRAYAHFVHAEVGYLDTIAHLKRAELEHDPMSAADYSAAHDATIGVLAALLSRHQSGLGQHVDISLAHSMLFRNELAAVVLSDTESRPKSAAFASAIFRTADGQAFTAGNPVSSEVFERLCRSLAQTALIEDPRFSNSASRRENRAALLGELQDAALAFQSVDEIERRLSDERLAYGRVRALADLPAAQWAIERGALTTAEDGDGGNVILPSSPWIFSRDAAEVGGFTSLRGQDNRDVLRELLDYPDIELDRLERIGVLSTGLSGT